MKHLEAILNQLQTSYHQDKQVYNYVVPKLWVYPHMNLNQAIQVYDGHVIVNPYEYYHNLIKYHILNQSVQAPKKDKWLLESVVYSMMIRTSASYDHDRSGHLESENLYQLKETGTFLKAMAYLPRLKQMGVNTLYLLPISRYSRQDKKGELGSVYAVSNFFEIDDDLKDPLLPAMSVKEQFKAFVEACHLLDIKVIIDIIPRTNSIHSDYLIEHPEWFYWIKHEALLDYKPPYVKGLPNTLPAKKDYFKALFSDAQVIEHLNKFQLNPKEANPRLWQSVLDEYKAHPESSFLELVQKAFKLTVAPAFSDRINDPQPAWNDITYFRLYLDHPSHSLPYLKEFKDLPPYLLYDVAKASYNPGQIINEPLWELISDVLPTYIIDYQIDGCRIDMGHALPDELINRIITKAQALDPHFVFIAEELEIDNAQSAIEKGYDMIIGDGFIRLPRIKEGLFNSFVYGAINLKVPVFAAGETHDTPRLSARSGQEDLNEMVTLFNMFIPNTIPFINSGQELFEVQPMNLGLDSHLDDRFKLPKDHPLYGKLSLFDRFMFNYNHPKASQLIHNLETIKPIRDAYLSVMFERDSIYPIGFNAPWDRGAAIAYIKDNRCLIVVANTEFDHSITHTLKLDSLPSTFKTANQKVSCRFSSKANSHPKLRIDDYGIITLKMAAFEFVLLEIII